MAPASPGWTRSAPRPGRNPGPTWRSRRPARTGSRAGRSRRTSRPGWRRPQPRPERSPPRRRLQGQGAPLRLRIGLRPPRRDECRDQQEDERRDPDEAQLVDHLDVGVVGLEHQARRARVAVVEHDVAALQGLRLARRRTGRPDALPERGRGGDRRDLLPAAHAGVHTARGEEAGDAEGQRDHEHAGHQRHPDEQPAVARHREVGQPHHEADPRGPHDRDAHPQHVERHREQDQLVAPAAGVVERDGARHEHHQHEEERERERLVERRERPQPPSREADHAVVAVAEVVQRRGPDHLLRDPHHRRDRAGDREDRDEQVAFTPVQRAAPHDRGRQHPEERDLQARDGLQPR